MNEPSLTEILEIEKLSYKTQIKTIENLFKLYDSFNKWLKNEIKNYDFTEEEIEKHILNLLQNLKKQQEVYSKVENNQKEN